MLLYSSPNIGCRSVTCVVRIWRQPSVLFTMCPQHQLWLLDVEPSATLGQSRLSPTGSSAVRLGRQPTVTSQSCQPWEGRVAVRFKSYHQVGCDWTLLDEQALACAYLSSLPILAVVYRFLLPFLPSYRQPTDLPQSTDFYRFFSRIYRILIFSTDLFVISCKLCSHKCYFRVLMVKSVKKFLYLNFQATCNVLAQWVKCRWLVVAHFVPQGNFQMLTGMLVRNSYKREWYIV